jgi:hypothetical protein
MIVNVQYEGPATGRSPHYNPAILKLGLLLVKRRGHSEGEDTMNIDATASRLASQGVAFASQIAQAAQRHGLDPDLLAAVAAQETGGPDSNAGHNVLGDGGHGHGVFQIDDRWHEFARTTAAMDPASNADYAGSLLAGLLGRYGGNVREALSAYNSGSPTASGTRTRWGNGQELGYADSVLQHYARLVGATPRPAGSPNTGLAAAATSDASPAGFSSLFAALAALESPMLQPPQSSQPPAPQQYQQQTIDYAGLLDNNGEN